MAEVPPEYTGGRLESNNNDVAMVLNRDVTGLADGVAMISGKGWTYLPANASGCYLDPASLTVGSGDPSASQCSGSCDFNPPIQIGGSCGDVRDCFAMTGGRDNVRYTYWCAPAVGGPAGDVCHVQQNRDTLCPACPGHTAACQSNNRCLYTRIPVEPPPPLPPPPPSASFDCTFTANPLSLSRPGTSRLTWSCSGGVGPISCTLANGSTTVPVSSSGSRDENITATRTFTLSCNRGGENITKSQTVRILSIIEVTPQ